MPIECSLACGWPCCSNPAKETTSSSTPLRVTLVALGAVSLVVCALIHFKIPYFHQLGSIGLGVSAGAGALFIFSGVSFRCVKSSQKSVAIQLPENAPIDIIQQFPKWFKEYMSDIPYLKLPKAAFGFEAFDEGLPPVTVVSSGENIGLYMKLKVQHTLEVPSYVSTRKNDPHLKSLTISSNAPFTLPVYIWKTDPQYSHWGLSSDPNLEIVHRHASFPAERILQNNLYNCCAQEDLKEEAIKELLTTENQDDLSADDRYNLAWLLLRLINEKYVLVRENPSGSFLISSKGKAIGYWKISLPTQQDNEKLT